MRDGSREASPSHQVATPEQPVPSRTDGRRWAGPSSLLPRFLGMGPPCTTAGPACIKHPGCPPEAGETEVAPSTRCRHTGRQARTEAGEAVLLLCIHVWSLSPHSAPLLQLCTLCQRLPQPAMAPPQVLTTREHGAQGPQPPRLFPGARAERRQWGQKRLQVESSSAAQRAPGSPIRGCTGMRQHHASPVPPSAGAPNS